MIAAAGIPRLPYFHLLFVLFPLSRAIPKRPKRAGFRQSAVPVCPAPE